MGPFQDTDLSNDKIHYLPVYVVRRQSGLRYFCIGSAVPAKIGTSRLTGVGVGLEVKASQITPKCGIQWLADDVTSLGSDNRDRF